jgi:hypothetical protein
MGLSMQPLPAPEFSPPMPFYRRLVGIYLSPRATFADIVRNPDFILPLIAVGLMDLLGTEAAFARIGADRLPDLMITYGAPGVHLAGDQQSRELFTRFTILALHLRAVWAPLIMLPWLAAVTATIVRKISRADLTFRLAFSVASYAYLVYLPGAVLALGAIYLRDPERFKPLLPSPTNLGFFLNPLEIPRSLIRLAGALDILTIWFLILFGIGISVATRGRVKARLVTLGYLGVGSIFLLALAGMDLFTRW